MRLCRFFPLLLLPLATACVETGQTPQHIAKPQDTSATAAKEVPTVRAHYAQYPEALMAATAQACSDPSETLLRKSRLWNECHILVSPRATAGLIMQYNGTMENLPKLVISFRLFPKSGGAYELHQQSYALVPQRKGGAVKVAYPDRVLDEKMRKLIRRSGGVPL